MATIDNSLVSVGVLNVPMLLPKPLLGFNTWYSLGGSVSETTLLEQAALLKNTGLFDKGYNFIGIDGRWENGFGADGVTPSGLPQRTEQGVLIPNQFRFPNGMKVVTDALHALGLKVGIYSSPAQYTCNNVDVGSQGHEEIDAQTFAEWGFDLLKYDHCGLSGTEQQKREKYKLMAGYLFAQAHPVIMYSCYCGTSDSFIWPGPWASRISQCWRIANDPVYSWDNDWINVTWKGAAYMTIYERALLNQQYVKPNAFPDLGVFNVTNTGTTNIEKRTMFGILVMCASQIWISSILSDISEYCMGFLKNEIALSIHQNNKQVGCQRIYNENNHDIVIKELENGYALFLLNRDDSVWSFNIIEDYVSYLRGTYQLMNVTDVWNKSAFTLDSDIELASHDSLLLLFENQ